MQKVAKFLLKPTVPVVNINGLITERSVEQLEHHLKDIRVSTAKALAVVINSPGGSPTQSLKIVEKIQNFAHEHHLPVYTFAEDLAASAGYQILISGDKVYADESSLVGSIGAIANFVNLKSFIQNQGIEVRRVSTNPQSASNQSIANDMPEELRKSYEELVTSSFKKFIANVEEQRSSKIKISKEKRDSLIYNGDVFNGRQALEYGLVDSIGRVQEIMAEEFPKAEVVYAKKPSPTGKIIEYAKLYNVLQTVFSK